MHLLGSLAMSIFLATSAFAQSIVVGTPSPGANIPLTSNLTVQIERHNSLSFSKEVSVAIGFKVCDAIEGCGPSAQVLYNGPYTPTLHTPTFPDSSATTRTLPSHPHFLLLDLCSSLLFISSMLGLARIFPWLRLLA
ncbi:hypothetical protein C8J57DRAFT_1478401 [Mycena rebaudengoi]|nr:hypothetical protein C8J57DRAFT_1478401 [Mycena rebaudengoi]